MKCFLRMGNDPLEAAIQHGTKADAIAEFRESADELARYGQPIEATLHYAASFDDLAEYPDFALSLGPRGGTRCERC